MIKKPRPPRQYEEIWLRIKASPNTTITLHAPAHLHARVAKALKKERVLATPTWPDSECYRLTYKSEGTKLCVYLKALAGATAMAELKSIDLTHLLPPRSAE